MKKWLILLMMMLVMPLTMAALDQGVECQVSGDNTSWSNITTTRYNGCIDKNESVISIQNLDAGKDWYFRCRNSTTNYTYVSQRTNDEVELSMASLAIVIFILATTAAVFYLPFKMDFLKNEIANLMIKRSLWVFGFVLMVLNSAILATLAAAAGLTLGNEIYLYMQMFGWACYIMIVYIFVRSIFDIQEALQKANEKERMGEEDEDHE